MNTDTIQRQSIERTLFENKLEEWIEELDYNEKATSTLKSYKRNIEQFIEFLPEKVEIITKNEVRQFKEYLFETFKTSSSNWKIISLNKYLKYLNKNEMIVKTRKRQQKFINEEVLEIVDYKRLLRIAKRNNYENIYYIIKILAQTGIRINELKYFTKENLEEKYLIIFNKNKERVIFIPNQLKRELKSYSKRNKISSGTLFPNKRTGKQVSKVYIWKQMKKLSGLARVKKSKVHSHSFRHLFAQIYLQEHPNDILNLADILGHNSLNTTRIYTQGNIEQQRKNVENLPL